MTRMRIGVLYGGPSTEHEVSIRSAQAVVEVLRRGRHADTPWREGRLHVIFVDRKGGWYLCRDDERDLAHPSDAVPVILVPDGKGVLFNRTTGVECAALDVLFPMIHGAYGEDGTIQGVAHWAGVACVGANLSGSAIAFDKDIAKRMLAQGNIDVVPFYTCRSLDDAKGRYEELSERFGGGHLVIKPARQGSSIGVSQVTAAHEYRQGIEEAFRYDTKVIIEQYIDGEELEIGILTGDRSLESTEPGWIRPPAAQIYTYEEKYGAQSGTTFSSAKEILDAHQRDEISKIAIESCRLLGVDGMARVDFFYERNCRRFYLNEINTIPGFTEISMFPKLWCRHPKFSRHADPLLHLIEHLIVDAAGR